MIFVGFYTPGRYEREADRLRASLDSLGLPHDLRRIEDRGTWAENAGHTAAFICRMLDEYKPDPIVYVDVDAVVWSNPAALDELSPATCDIAAHRCAWGQLANGTLWLANTDACRGLIEDYRRRVAANPKERDEQRHLDLALQANAAIRFRQLPATYCYIHKLMKLGSGEEPVIEHLQASRECGSSLLDIRRKRIQEIEERWTTNSTG